MRCSFKNIRINILLFTVIIMTLVGRGNPENLRNVRGEGTSNAAVELKESPEYVEENGHGSGYGRGNAKLRKSVEREVRYSRNENQAIPDPKIVKKRRRVSLNHFPEEISRRKTEGSNIRQMNVREANYDNTRDRVPNRRSVRAGHTGRRNAPYRNHGYYPVDSPPGVLRNTRKWLLQNGRLAFPEGTQNEVVDDIEGDGAVVEQFEPCCKMGQAENAAPQTYMVEVEPLDDGEGAALAAAQPQFPLCNKYYYVFEKKPFKVKFLNFVSSPSRDCVPPAVRSPFSANTPLKLSMPAFLCRPPECREVLYCKYFQCTSLGFFPDSRNCRKYFFCDLNSNGFVLYHMLCPKGRIFDPCIRECRLKETMDKRDVERCWMEAAKLNRGGGKARIKKNESLSRDLIKYKERGDNEKYKNSNSNILRRNSTADESENINSRHNPKHGHNKKPDHTNDNKMTTLPAFTYSPLSFATQLIPIPILASLPKYCETASMPISTTPYPPTAPAMPQTPHPQSPSPPKQPAATPPPPPPPPPPPGPTIISVTRPPPPPPPTTKTTPSIVVATSLPTTSPPAPTTEATAGPVLVQKSTLPICPPPPKRKKVTCPPSTNLDEYYMGDLDSDAYQDDMIEDEYSDDYYDAPDAEDGQEEDYDWLKQGLKEYLDMLKLNKEAKTEADTLEPKIYSGQSTPPPFNGNAQNTEGKDQERGKFLQPGADRGKRSEEKTENATTVVDRKENPSELPDFEKCYNGKKEMNLDGYPCKRYGRYPDKYDSTRYYECGAQPDGNMKIEHKRCPKGEEFSPEYLECVATEYLRVTHRRKRIPEARRPNKQRPKPEPEYNYEDDKEIPNEWLDASHGNKVPNEFKSKTKHTLRIFHLYCKRNSTEPPQRLKRNRGGHGHEKQRHSVRSFVIRHNKKEDQLDDDEDEEYEDDDEDYYDLAEEDGKGDRSVQGVSDSSSATSPSSKVLLDADIRVDKEFENDLKSILGKRGDEPEPKKDSILITLSGDKRSERSKRNFLKDLFSKKSSGDDPEKEGVVSMLTLINGLPSEYERDALLQKLERRKMMNSHLYRNRQRTLKKKANSDLDLASDEKGLKHLKTLKK